MISRILRLSLIAALLTTIVACGSDSKSQEEVEEVTVLDFDNDGIADSEDNDIDGDGYDNESDAFDYDASEHQDVDNDGIGDNADTVIPVNATLIGNILGQQIVDAMAMFVEPSGEAIVVPTRDGLYSLKLGTDGQPTTEYDLLLKEEFADLNIEQIQYAKSLTNGNIYLSGIGRVEAVVEGSPISVTKPVILTLNYNATNNSYSIAHRHYVIAESGEELSDYQHNGTIGGVEQFSITEDGQYLYAQVQLGDYLDTFIVAYALQQDGSLSYVNAVDAQRLVGLPSYEKNMAVTSDNNFLFYASQDVIGVFNINNITGAISYSAQQRLDDVWSVAIETTRAGQLLVASDKSLSSFSIDNTDGKLTEVDKLVYEQSETGSPLYMAINPTSDKVVITNQKNVNNVIFAAAVESNGMLSKLTSSSHNGLYLSLRWSNNNEQLYAANYFGGNILNLNLNSKEVDNTDLGSPYSSRIDKFDVGPQTLVGLDRLGNVTKLKVAAGEIVASQQFLEANLDEDLSTYFYNSYFSDPDTIISTIRYDGSNGSTYKVRQFKLDANGQLASSNTLLDSTSPDSNDGSYNVKYYNAWPMPNDAIVVLETHIEIGYNQVYEFQLYELDSTGRLNLSSRLPIDVSTFYSAMHAEAKLENDVTFTFYYWPEAYSIENGELTKVSRETSTDDGHYFHSGKVKLTTGYNEFSVMLKSDDTSEFVTKESVTLSKLHNVTKFDDASFLLFESDEQGDLFIRKQTISQEGEIADSGYIRLKNIELTDTMFDVRIEKETGEIWVILTEGQKEFMLVSFDE